MEAAQLADDLKAQLEVAQKKLHDFQDEIVENSVTKEKQNVYKAERIGERSLVNFMGYFYFGGIMKESKVFHLYVYTTSLSIYSSVDIWVASVSWLL